MNNYFGFQGKTVVVTGASSGMGEAAAKMLVDLGAEVHACGSYEATVEWFEKNPEKIQGSYVVTKQAVNAYVKYKVFAKLCRTGGSFPGGAARRAVPETHQIPLPGLL